MNPHRTALTGMIVAFAALAATPAHAAESYDACIGTIPSLPAVLAAQGTWCMNKDLATAIGSGNAITIASNNITIDCNGFKLGGLAAGSATQTIGIAAINRQNVTVRGCNVRGFRTGIRVEGAGALIERNRLEGNTYFGIVVVGDQGLVEANRVFDTGGTTEAASAQAYGILVNGEIDVVGNTVAGVASTGFAAPFGIYTEGAPAIVRDNRVRDVAALVTVGAYAVYIDSDYGSVRGNEVMGTGASLSVGIFCGNTAGIAVRDNVMTHFDSAMVDCGQTLDNQTID